MSRTKPRARGNGSSSEPAPGEEAALEQAFERSVSEGIERVNRSWPALIATGLVGGLDVSVGVFALFVVRADTHNVLLSSLAFSVGFIALTLAGSELFTENFLVPIMALVAKRDTTPLGVVRLWAGTLVANFVSGSLMMALIVHGFPRLSRVAIAAGSEYPKLGIGFASAASALIAGMAITLMTWMERNTQSEPARLLATIAVAFVLAAGPLLHTVVAGFEMIAAVMAGASFGYRDAAGMIAWAIVWNAAGGIGLVTVLRLVQVGRGTVTQVRSAG
jgi:formate/nitrite transporter FocA (FNT family)